LYAVVDIETTGSIHTKDKIIEIAIILHNGIEVVDEYSTLLNPKQHISKFIQSFTGISDDMVIDAPTFERVAKDILKFTEGCIFVAHNVKFDYGFIQAEFRRIGIEYKRKNICTVELSRKIIPGMNSYSLGNLCRDLGIPLTHRHRAFGDARATVQLLELLLQKDTKKFIADAIIDELKKVTLPNNIDYNTIDTLPEQLGVFYFYNNDGKVIYIDKAKNIRSHVIKLIKNEKKDQRITTLLKEIDSLSYEITGSELTASLIEVIDLKQYKPVFNKSSTMRSQYKYGLYANTDDNGYYNMMVKMLHIDELPVLKFTTKTRAERVLNEIFHNFNIQPTLKKIENVVNYNNRVEKVLQKYLYPYLNFMIIEEGRNAEEKVAIWIENGIFKGIGYFNPDDVKNNYELLKDLIKPHTEHSDIRKIIQTYIHKNKMIKMIRF
jgi:DNA polymerase-3 subunit epsilon